MQLKQRPIDDTEPFYVTKDIEHDKKIASAIKLKVENDIKKVLNAFDTKKKIQIPKSLNNISINNNNSKNNNLDKNERKKNNQQSTYINFELSEFKRPDSYIIYSSKEREQLNIKDYEAKSADFLFLEYHGDFMKIEELEKIISVLENNIGKSEKIPDEMAKKIIEENFSKYKSKSDLIIKHFNDRRNELKKSLLRKYWRLQKSTDKYFASTFRRREREKMKIRKNNQKKEESFEKIRMAGELCKNHLLPIINTMTNKEKLNKKKALLENLMFLSEINLIQKNNIPKEYIIKNNEIVSSLKENGFLIDENIINLEERDKFELYKEDIPILREGGTPSTKDEIIKDDIIKDEDSFNNDKKNNNQEIIFPPINIGYFNNSIKNKNKEVNNNNKYRVRIRLNRIKKLAVDRYIQKNDSMDPFDDAFNEKIMKYQKYEPSLALNSINYNSFEKLLKEYYEQKYKFLSFISDSDEEYDSILKTKKNNKRMMNKKRAYNK